MKKLQSVNFQLVGWVNKMEKEDQMWLVMLLRERSKKAHLDSPNGCLRGDVCKVGTSPLVWDSL